MIPVNRNEPGAVHEPLSDRKPHLEKAVAAHSSF